MMHRASISGFSLAAVLLFGPARAQVTLFAPAFAPAAQEDAAAAENQLPLTKLTLDPAAEPEPALRYTLATPYSQRKAGNAAQFYYRALLLQAQLPAKVQEQYNERYEHWRDTPLDGLPKEEMRKWLGNFHSVLLQVEEATRREYCDWDLRLQDLNGIDQISFLLPEFQELRGLARMMQVKLRLEIAERRYDDAIETLQMGYQMARDTAKPPLLISVLVGVAIAAIVNDQLEELIASDGAPNLYWAIAALDRPLVDMRRAILFEMQLPPKIFPFLSDAATGERSPQQWRNMIVDSLLHFDSLGSSNPTLKGEYWKAELAAAALTVKAYPQAKRQLIQQGMSPDQVEAMPVGQVVTMAASRAYYHIYHEAVKWSLLPYWRGHKRMHLAEKTLQEEGYLSQQSFSREILPIASLLMPAVSAASRAPIRLERNIAVLQTLEALRMHAAGHQGRLPKTLAEIDVVIVPLNPATGKLFPYRLRGNVAQLDLLPPAGMPVQRYGKRYEITISPATDKP